MPLAVALITCARDEEAFLPTVIESVIAQTHRPVTWIIANDGSKDRTREIILEYAKKEPWIRLQDMVPSGERLFSGKARAFNAAYATLANEKFDLIGNLDADITIYPDHFDFLTGKFESTPELGVGGVPFCEDGATYNFRFSSPEHVSGACQLFRRACFEQLGGYQVVSCGGIDVIAVLTARMNGWKTRTFPEKHCVHHRKMGTASYGRLAAKVKLGVKDYVLGRDPLWQAFRCVYQMAKRPYGIGGMAIAYGYYSSVIRRRPRAVTPELMTFQRAEQMQRLRRALWGDGGKAAPVAARQS
jgi:biofilm PGA synthesis N-glycosyltransferase PgaC